MFYFCCQLEQQTGFYRPVSPTQGSRMAAPRPPCPLLSPLCHSGIHSLKRSSSHWVLLPLQTLVCDCEQRLWGPARPVTPLASRTHLGAAAIPRRSRSHTGGLWLVLIAANFCTHRFPTSEAPFGGLYHHDIGLTVIESDSLFMFKQQ